MSRGAKISLGLALAVVVAIGIVVGVRAGFHGVVIYAFFASVALATTALISFGGEGITRWSRERFREDGPRR